MKRISNDHQEWSVFHFTVMSGEKRRRVAVASTNRAEAETLVSAMYGKATVVQKKRRAG